MITDALHCQRGHAVYLHERQADFVFCVKGNQPNLYRRLDKMPWNTAQLTSIP